MQLYFEPGRPIPPHSTQFHIKKLEPSLQPTTLPCPTAYLWITFNFTLLVHFPHKVYNFFFRFRFLHDKNNYTHT